MEAKERLREEVKAIFTTLNAMPVSLGDFGISWGTADALELAIDMLTDAQAAQCLVPITEADEED